MRIRVLQKLIDLIRCKKDYTVIEKNESIENENVFIPSNENYPIRLSDNEKDFLVRNIKDANVFLEYGSGGSTFLSLLNTKIAKIVSVESDNNWLEYLRNWEIIRVSEKNSNLEFISVDIGKTGDWGFPIELDKKELFPNYSCAPFSSNKEYDVVFIDGRFRVACALQTIFNCKKDVKILIHDFNDRPEYHCILEFLDIVDTADTMALFKIKDSYNKYKLAQLYEIYKYVTD